MSQQSFNTVIVGAGQAGLAISAHLQAAGVDHVVLEKARVAEAWRTRRWDSLVANGPAWHDRFPDKEFNDFDADEFPGKDAYAQYFEDFATERSLPIRTGITVERVQPKDGGYVVETTGPCFNAQNIVVATGPFQIPVIPPVVPSDAPVTQLHSQHYFNPDQLEPGGVLVVGAGSSGSQIADELLRADRQVYLSIGPHDRPPRRYRGKDFVWWLGKLGKWETKTPPAGREHVTIAVSGAYGGQTIDFRNFADRGMALLGMTTGYSNGKLRFASDLADTIRDGDASLLDLLREADAYVTKHALDLPDDPDAHELGPLPRAAMDPQLSLDLQGDNIRTIIWATGYHQDFSWLKVNCFDSNGAPQHKQGIGKAPGIYFLGLPWLSMRGSSFIWGVWVDAARLSGHIAAKT